MSGTAGVCFQHTSNFLIKPGFSLCETTVKLRYAVSHILVIFIFMGNLLLVQKVSEFMAAKG